MKINKPAQQKEIGAPTFTPQLPLLTSKKKEALAAWLPLWLCAAFLLFGNLGVQAVNGSESRWLVIAREMFFTGDFLHPTINFEPYFDKPLLTYFFKFRNFFHISPLSIPSSSNRQNQPSPFQKDIVSMLSSH